MTHTGAHWQHFDHEADIGIRGIGPTQAQAFEQAALAMTAAVTQLENISARHAVRIECNGDDPEMLLVDWLNAVIYEMATRRMLFSQYDVNIENDKLMATAWGETVHVQRHQPAVEIKGATYTALQVIHMADGQWIAETVVDV
jgi:SHS2 domain-containing protein